MLSSLFIATALRVPRFLNSALIALEGAFLSSAH
jgi:hypothetical protein